MILQSNCYVSPVDSGTANSKFRHLGFTAGNSLIIFKFFETGLWHRHFDLCDPGLQTFQSSRKYFGLELNVLYKRLWEPADVLSRDDVYSGSRGVQLSKFTQRDYGAQMGSLGSKGLIIFSERQHWNSMEHLWAPHVWDKLALKAKIISNNWHN